MTSWALYIDLEGFSNLYTNKEDSAIILLTRLAYDLYKIGHQICNRLFIFQFGDGFLVNSDVNDEKMELPFSISVALLSAVLLRGGLAKVAIATGDMVDIRSCFPEEMTHDGDIIKFGREGRMIIQPVIGAALVNCVLLSKKAESGPKLLIDNTYRLPQSDDNIYILKNQIGKGYIDVDWIRSGNKFSKEILRMLIGYEVSPGMLIDKLKLYLAQNEKLPLKIKTNIEKLINN